MYCPELAFHFKDDVFADCERRRWPRVSVAKTGKIILRNGWTTVSVAISDLSAAGARLQVAMADELPATFKLVIDRENVIIPVRLSWRRDDEVGVAFAGRREPAPLVTQGPLAFATTSLIAS